jgi:hypothetical protein
VQLPRGQTCHAHGVDGAEQAWRDGLITEDAREMRAEAVRYGKQNMAVSLFTADETMRSCKRCSCVTHFRRRYGQLPPPEGLTRPVAKPGSTPDRGRDFVKRFRPPSGPEAL